VQLKWKKEIKMTNYILHGGAAKRETEKNKEFFKTILDSTPDQRVILVVCFAKPKDV